MAVAANTMRVERGSLPLLILSYAAFIAIGLPDGVLNIAWTYMQGTFEVNNDRLGTLLIVAMVGRLITAFTSGRLIARLGMAGFLIVGVGLFIAGLFGYVLASSWIGLLAVAAVAAMGAGALDAGLNTFVTAHYSNARLNWLHAAFGIGATFGPILAAAVLRFSDWRAAYAIALVPAIAVGVLFVMMRGAWSGGALVVPPSQRAGAEQPSIWQTLRTPLVGWGVLLFFVYGGAELGTAQLSNTLFVEGREIDQGIAASWISAYWGLFTVGRILMGFVADRINTHLLLRVLLIAAVVGAGLLSWNPFPQAGIVALVIMGFAFAPLFATLISQTPDRVGARHAANTIGFQVGVVGLGGAILPGIAGFLEERVGVEIIPITLIVATVALLLIYEGMMLRERTRAKR